MNTIDFNYDPIAYEPIRYEPSSYNYAMHAHPEPPQQQQPDKELNLHKLLGGESTIRAAIQTVTRRMLGDSCLAFFIVRQDFAAAQDYLVDFFSSVLTHGIPEDTSLIDEAVAEHLKRLFTMGLTVQHFDLMLGHLILTLDSFGVHRSVSVEVVRAIRPLRNSCELGAKQAKSRQVSARFSLVL